MPFTSRRASLQDHVTDARFLLHRVFEQSSLRVRRLSSHAQGLRHSTRRRGRIWMRISLLPSLPREQRLRMMAHQSWNRYERAHKAIRRSSVSLSSLSPHCTGLQKTSSLHPNRAYPEAPGARQYRWLFVRPAGGRLPACSVQPGQQLLFLGHH